MAASHPRRALGPAPTRFATPSTGRWHSVRQNAVDVLLWTLGGLGLLSLIAAVVAHVWGFSIILFSTGSMTPTIPAGSAALVRLLPASDFHVGDITTIERQDLLPITHRITSIKPLDGSPSARVITMRGDANDQDDPQPYVVNNARLVVASVAGVATMFAGMRDPRLMGVLTLLAGGLVMWAFWPRTARKATIVAAAVLVAGSQILGATDANAAGTEDQVVGRHMVLTVISDTDAMSSMKPGLPVLWQVGVARRADEEGALHIGLGLANGTVDAGALKVDVQACPERWQGEVCDGLAQNWVSDVQLDQAFLPATHEDTRELGSTLADKPIWILVKATMTRSNPDIKATLKLAAWGSGEVVSAESDGHGGGHGSGLAYTGPDGLFGTLSLAGAAIGTGLVIARLAGRRRREPDEDVR